MAGHWYAIPLVCLPDERTARSPVCDGEVVSVHGDRCTRLARWVYVGESGELYACDAHHALAVQP